MGTSLSFSSVAYEQPETDKAKKMPLSLFSGIQTTKVTRSETTR